MGQDKEGGFFIGGGKGVFDDSSHHLTLVISFHPPHPTLCYRYNPAVSHSLCNLACMRSVLEVIFIQNAIMGKSWFVC